VELWLSNQVEIQIGNSSPNKSQFYFPSGQWYDIEAVREPGKDQALELFFMRSRVETNKTLSQSAAKSNWTDREPLPLP